MLTVALIISACSGEADAESTTTEGPPDATTIVGAWERVGGDFSELTGMVVTVASEGADGLITSTPPNQYGFVVGDIKWASIVEIEVGEYSFDDLVRETANDSTSYVSGTLAVAADGATLEMSFESGTVQEWRRTG